MNKSQQAKFESLYRKHVSALRRQGKAEKTVEAYSRAVRRLSEFFDASPADITQPQIEAYFDSLIRTHSWSTIKCDRNGLQFFYEHVLKLIVPATGNSRHAPKCRAMDATALRTIPGRTQ